MTSRLSILVIDHRDHDYQPPGKIIMTRPVKPGDSPGDAYADFTALYGAWQGMIVPPAFIGFFGYRKYLTPLEHAGLKRVEPVSYNEGWWQCNEEVFNDYRERLAMSDGQEFLELLGQYDILKAPPYRLHGNADLLSDFANSRSMADALVLSRAMHMMGWRPTKQIHPYLFITRWEVFDRFMRETDSARRQIESQITVLDVADYAYKHRPMAYIMERVFSLWYDHSDLLTLELPLLHCWDKA